MLTKSRTRYESWFRGNWNSTYVVLAARKEGIGPCPWTPFVVEGGVYPPHNHEVGTSERIDYENSNWLTPNPCYHTSTLVRVAADRSVSTPFVPHWDYTWDPAYPPGVLPRVTNDFDLSWLHNLGWGFSDGRYDVVGPQLDVAAEIADKLAQLKAGSVQMEFALPRAIIELKDVPQTVKGLVDICKALTAIPEYLSKPGAVYDAATYTFGSKDQNLLRSRGCPRTLASLASATQGSLVDVAKAYLTHAFGVKPTVADARNFLGLNNPKKGNGRSTKLLFQTQKVEYKKGQKLRVPIRLGFNQSDFPSTDPLDSGTISTGLLVNYHSACGITDWIQSQAAFDKRPVVRTTVDGCLFAEVERDDSFEIPYSERLAYSGGFLSTMYEVTPWSFVVDWMYDVGKLLQTFEKASFPTQYRPKLKFGAWKSIRECGMIFYPVRSDLRAVYTSPYLPVGSSQWMVDQRVTAGKATWLPAWATEPVYVREPFSPLESSLYAPSVHAPGRYALGTSAALLTSLWGKRK